MNNLSLVLLQYCVVCNWALDNSEAKAHLLNVYITAAVIYAYKKYMHGIMPYATNVVQSIR